MLKRRSRSQALCSVCGVDGGERGTLVSFRDAPPESGCLHNRVRLIIPLAMQSLVTEQLAKNLL